MSVATQREAWAINNADQFFRNEVLSNNPDTIETPMERKRMLDGRKAGWTEMTRWRNCDDRLESGTYGLVTN